PHMARTDSSPTVVVLFSFMHTAPPNIYTLSLHDALPIYHVLMKCSFVTDSTNTDLERIQLRSLTQHDGILAAVAVTEMQRGGRGDRKSTRLNSSHVSISYAVFCLNKKSDNIIT